MLTSAFRSRWACWNSKRQTQTPPRIVISNRFWATRRCVDYWLRSFANARSVSCPGDAVSSRWWFLLDLWRQRLGHGRKHIELALRQEKEERSGADIWISLAAGAQGKPSQNQTSSRVNYLSVVLKLRHVYMYFAPSAPRQTSSSEITLWKTQYGDSFWYVVQRK